MHTANAIRLAILCGLAPPALASFDGFAPRIDLPLTAGYNPTASALADFDNDGDLDIAVTAFTSQSLDYVAVILNNGNGTFAGPAYYRVGDSPIAIVAADVNLDGDADILVANRDTDDFSVRLGNGDGTFGPEDWEPVGARPQDIAVADFNADGSPDVAVANEFDDSVSVYFNNGDGTFTHSADYTTNNPDGNFGHNPRGLVAADLNFDGLPDLATANISSNTGTLLYNISGAPGLFYSSEFAYFIPLSDGPIAVDAHDHDGDGDIDLVYACTNGIIQRRWNEFNNEPGTVFPDFPTSSTFNIGGSRPVGICTADFGDLLLTSPRSPDADRDLVIADEVLNDIDILLNNGSGGIVFGGRHDAASSPQNPSAGDLDGDGDHDVVAPQYGDHSVGVFLNISTVVGGPAPVVSIIEPGDYGATGGCVCGPSMIVRGVAEIPAGGIFEGFVLDYRRSSQPENWQVISSSSGMVPDPGGTLGTWDLTGEPEGIYVLRLTAVSASGLSATDEAVVWVSQNYNTNTFHFAAGYGDTASTTIAGRNICVTGTVNDDACGANTYTVDYRPVSGGAWLPVDPASPVYSGDRLNTELARWNTVALGIPDGDYAVRVIGTNGCGQTNTETRSVTVDNTPPVAEITGPTNCFWLDPGSTFIVKGTAFDEHLSSWTLEFTGGPYTTWRPIETSTTNVVNSVLAEWDTSGLPPCAYSLRLRVYDASSVNCGSSTQRTDAISTVNIGCRADLAEPYNILDLLDITTFVESFTGGCP